jgi:hypothetical protein
MASLSWPGAVWRDRAASPARDRGDATKVTIEYKLTATSVEAKDDGKHDAKAKK